MNPAVLYVHPYNHLVPQAIPLGALTAINSLPGGAVGRYAHEVSRQDLERAQIILLDAHWFFSLPVLPALLQEYRRVAPDACVIVGGLTASVYQRIFFDAFDVDFVLVGDTEVSIGPLVEALLEGRAPPPLPNVCTRTEHDPPRQRLTQQQFDALDWITIDWFPSYQKAMADFHREVGATSRGWADCYPLLPVTRGCVRSCSYCYGSYQCEVFGSSMLCRSAEALRRDLLALQAQPEVSFVTVYVSDAAFLTRLAEACRGQRFSLDGYLFFCGAPPGEALRTVTEAFAGEVVCSVIQSSDLAPRSLPGGAGAAERRTADFLREYQPSSSRRAVIWYMSRPEPEVVAACDGERLVQTASGIDWGATRPHVGDPLFREAPVRQLELVREAARRTAAAHLLAAVVPSLRAIPVLAFGDDDLFNPLHRPDCDAFEQELVRRSQRNLMEEGFYGFEDLSLAWGLAEPSSDAPGHWGPCGRSARGSCRWFFEARGLAWSGELELENQAELALSLLPTVVGQGEPLPLAAWDRARVPCLLLAAGGRRVVRAGGRVLGTELELWLDEEGVGLRTWRLSREKPSESMSERRWPHPTWPQVVLRVVQAAARQAELTVTQGEITATDLRVTWGRETSRLVFVVFPARAGTRYRSTGRLSFSYSPEVRDEEGRRLVELFDRCLTRAEMVLDRLGNGAQR